MCDDVSDLATSLSRPVTAIRTSGTFGIHDDGPELYTNGAVGHGSLDPSRPGASRRRAESDSGSLQSGALQRVLFVKNLDETVVEDDEDEPRHPTVSEENTEESGESRDAFYTPVGFGSPFSPSSEHTSLQADQMGKVNASAPTRPRIAHHRSMSPPSARSATFKPLTAPSQSKPRPLTPPPTQATPHPHVLDDSMLLLTPPLDSRREFSWSRAARSTTPFASVTEAETMLDEATQTSPTDELATIRRPLPRPPSVSSRPSSLVVSATSKASVGPLSPPKQAEPLPRSPSRPWLNVPPPPQETPSPHASFANFTPASGSHEPPRSSQSSTPASDLPLLIASHLLSTHAAALMRHSATMRDVSEVMHQMAKESLEWGGLLLGMSQTGKQDPSGRRSDPQPGFPPFQLGSLTIQSNDLPSGIDGLPSREYPREGVQGQDPLRQAWERLHGAGHLPFAPQSPSKMDHRSDPGYTSGHQVPDQFTNIPPRPSATRKASRSRLQAEDWRGTVQRKHESLPSDRLSEADRLGREGWESLRRAEEAWSSAMSFLRYLAEQPLPSVRPIDRYSSAGTKEHVDERDGEMDRTVRAKTRSRHEPLDLSYPRRMNRTDRIDQDRSFVPNDTDMVAERHSGDLAKAERILGPYSGIDICPDFTPHPCPIQTQVPPLPFDENGGYTEYHLGFGDGTMRDRPHSRGMYSTASGRRGTRGRKLSKPRFAHAPLSTPSAFRASYDPALPPRGEAQVESGRRWLRKSSSIGEESMGKRHWWSRKRTGSVARG